MTHTTNADGDSFAEEPADRAAREHQRRERAWQPAARWQAIQETIRWAEAQATVRRIHLSPASSGSVASGVNVGKGRASADIADAATSAAIQKSEAARGAFASPGRGEHSRTLKRGQTVVAN